MGPIVAIPQVGGCTIATNVSSPKQNTILPANPLFAYSVFVVEHSQRAGSHEIAMLSGYRKNCDIAKHVRIEFLVGTGAPGIHGELLMLGFEVSERTVSRWMKTKRLASNLAPNSSPLYIWTLGRL